MRAPIVIFGAAVRPDGGPSTALRQRIEAALAFGCRQQDPLYIPTGAKGRFGAAEAAVMADLLVAHGVPESAILQETTGTDTLSSARACARLLMGRGHVGPVHVATSAYHLPRCLLLLRIAGLDVRACAPPAAPAATRFARRWYWRLREALALPYDVALALALRAAGRL